MKCIDKKLCFLLVLYDACEDCDVSLALCGKLVGGETCTIEHVSDGFRITDIDFIKITR